MNPYIGHPTQLYGVEEHRMIGGKGDGMRLYEVKNGCGLEITVCADRCMDIYRLSYRGINCGYFAPAGYVAPAYYDDKGNGFLKSFTAGFMTTCGLTTVGPPEEDDGTLLPLHGTIGNAPAEAAAAWLEGDHILLRGRINQSDLFSHKLTLERKITCPLHENTILIEDTVLNEGSTIAPFMLLYHMNMGYPLLSEKSCLTIPAKSILPRTEHAARDLATCHDILPPTADFEEQCYLHSFQGDTALARLYNPVCGIGLEISFDPGQLPCLTEWKMMGIRDYVLGLEPGTCFPTGRSTARHEGTLQFLHPGDAKQFAIQVTLRDI